MFQEHKTTSATMNLLDLKVSETYKSFQYSSLNIKPSGASIERPFHEDERKRN